MALYHPAALSLWSTCRSLGHGGGLDERRRALDLRARDGSGSTAKGLSTAAGFRLGHLDVSGSARLKLAESPPLRPAAAAKGQIRSGVEIPVTCYQILGVSEKAEKDEIVKAAMELKSGEIEDGYTRDAVVSRQDILVDVRDKLLFEPQYAGDVKEKVPPKSSLRIPWAWLPAALCLLQEVGEDKLVFDIGRAALQLSDVKPYVHDVLFSMSLAECSIAKTALEKSKISEGFEALARAQYLLRSKTSLEKMPLLTQIEESLEELAPACTLELLGKPQTPDNAERRRGTIAALCELVRQGLDAEVSCRVQDWPCFLSQAIDKLSAIEIVDLLSWDHLAAIRKNKKSLESQNQRVVIDFSCFYMAMMAHIALGFSKRQTDLISKAKTICDCLVESEGVDLKFVEAFCSLLLGQGSEASAVEKLRQLEVNGSLPFQGSESTVPNKEPKDKGTLTHSLEIWLKDDVLCLFPDTRDCPSSLANFFRGPRLSCSKQKTPTRTVPSMNTRSQFLGLSPERGAHTNSVTHLGEAVKKLAPANLQCELTLGKTTGSTTSAPSMQQKQNLGLHRKKIWESWGFARDAAGIIVLAGFFIFSTYKLMCFRYGYSRIPHKCHSSYTEVHKDLHFPGYESTFSIRNMWSMLREKFKHPTGADAMIKAWPDGEISDTAGGAVHRSQMPLEEAEALVKQWQDVKSEALGPNYQIQTLIEILADPMLTKWQDLANIARSRSSFWRFVLLQLSVLRADILRDEAGNEMAEIVALLEEAAELVDESQPKKSSYYSTYKVQYFLKRQDDGSWRFYSGGVENPESGMNAREILER